NHRVRARRGEQGVDGGRHRGARVLGRHDGDDGTVRLLSLGLADSLADAFADALADALAEAHGRRRAFSWGEPRARWETTYTTTPAPAPSTRAAAALARVPLVTAWAMTQATTPAAMAPEALRAIDVPMGGSLSRPRHAASTAAPPT